MILKLRLYFLGEWLYSNEANVGDIKNLNPFLGKIWYTAAREVTKTLVNRIAGSHQDVSLAKGTDLRNRELAKAFVQYLIKKGVLKKIKRSNTGPGWVVRVAPEHRESIREFSEQGTINEVLKEFFEQYISH